MKTIHPWQSGPLELIKYAIEHLHQEDEFNQRIAFLLLDVGVETLFKTFLQLPEEVTKTKVSFSERTKASEGNFHELIQGIKKAAGNRLSNIDLTHIQFYHDLRNKLYHQGNGITIPTEKANGYALLAVECLKSLLDVDLNPILSSKQEDELRQAKENIKSEELEQERKELRTQLDELYQIIMFALEAVEPSLVMPSFRREYRNWMEIYSKQRMIWFKKTFLEYEEQDITADGEFKPEQYSVFLEKIQPTMPSAFRDFVDKYHLNGEDIIAMIADDDFEVTMLNMAVIALKLNINRHHTFFKANLILGQEPVKSVMRWTSNNVEDPISESIRLSKEVSKEIQNIKDALLLGKQSL